MGRVMQEGHREGSEPEVASEPRALVLAGPARGRGGSRPVTGMQVRALPDGGFICAEGWGGVGYATRRHGSRSSRASGEGRPAKAVGGHQSGEPRGGAAEGWGPGSRTPEEGLAEASSCLTQVSHPASRTARTTGGSGGSPHARNSASMSPRVPASLPLLPHTRMLSAGRPTAPPHPSLSRLPPGDAPLPASLGLPATPAPCTSLTSSPGRLGPWHPAPPRDLFLLGPARPPGSHLPEAPCAPRRGCPPLRLPFHLSGHCLAGSPRSASRLCSSCSCRAWAPTHTDSSHGSFCDHSPIHSPAAATRTGYVMLQQQSLRNTGSK